MKALLLSLALGILVTVAPARAQNLCDGSTPLGRFVCDVPALGILSGELRALEGRLFASLPQEDRASLVEAQRRWRQYVTDLCIVTPARIVGDTTPAQEAVLCLQAALSARIKDLPRYTERIGGLAFRRMEVFAAGPIADPPPNGQTVWSVEAAYPALLEPSLSGTAWNRLVADRFAALLAYDPAPGRAGAVTADELIDYSVQYANDRAIGITWHSWTYGHGAAHGHPADAAMHYRLDQRRALAPTDVFTAGSGWEAALALLCFDELKRKHGEGLLPRSPADLAALVASPERWIFAGDGLQVFFNVYEVTPYVEGRQDVKLAWSRLAPYLRNGAPPDFFTALPVFLRR